MRADEARSRERMNVVGLEIDLKERLELCDFKSNYYFCSYTNTSFKFESTMCLLGSC